MPVDTLYASSLLSGSVAGSSNALGSTSGTWTTDALNTNVSWTSVWHIDDPANPSVKASRTGAGTQTVTAFVRKGSNTGNPGWRLGVSQGGTELAFGTGTVTSTTGQAFSFVFDGSGITDITDIRITLDITGVGGAGSARNTAQVDYLYLLWDYDIKASTVSATTTVGAPSMSATVAATTVAGSTTVSGSAVTPVPAVTVAATTTIGAPTVSGSVFAVPCGPGINWLRASAVFDGNINGWVSHNTSTVSYDASEGHTTPGSLKVIQTDGDNVVLSTVRTGYDHTIRYERVVYSLWVKTTVATQVRLTFRKVGSSVFVTQPAVTPGVWTRLDIDFINPTGFGDFLENIAFGVYASEPDTYWVDEVMVEYKSAQPASDFVINTAVPCTTTIGTPTVTTSSGTSATVSATTVAATAKFGIATGRPFPVDTAITSGVGHFIDQYGNPILVMGDAVWHLPHNAGRWTSNDWQTEIRNYLETRKGQGFNIVHFAIDSNTDFGGVYNDGRTYDGVQPFTTAGDPSSSLNETFWTRIDYLIDTAAQLGMSAFFAAWDGQYATDTAGRFLYNKTNTQFYDYGYSLGMRYKNRANIIWVLGDDYFGYDDAWYTNWNNGRLAAGDTHSISIMMMLESTSRKELQGSTTQHQFGINSAEWDLIYTYRPSYTGCEIADDTTPNRPYLFGNGYFLTGSTDHRVMRNMVWWALSSGSPGWDLGDERTWQWGSGSPSALTGTWYTQAAAIRTAFTALPNWHLLVPDTDSVLVTAGRGTHDNTYPAGTGGNEYTGTTDNWVSAARTPDKNLAVIYMSKSSSITINQSEMTTGYSAMWMDPTTGTTEATATGSTYSSSGKGNNAAGGTDWVLVLKFEGPTITATTVSASTSIASVVVEQSRPYGYQHLAIA